MNDLIRARQGVTPDTALRLAKALGTSPQLWMNLQEAWDLWHAAYSAGAQAIAAIEPRPHDASGAVIASA